MNQLPAFVSLASRTSTRQLSTSQIRCYKPDLSYIKKKQAHFQADNDIPVFLKGGSTDKVLFYMTLGFQGFCLANVVQIFSQEIFKK